MFPTMKSDRAEKGAQVNGQEQSNCLSPLRASASQCSSVYCTAHALSLSESISTLGVCWHVNVCVLALGGTTLFVAGTEVP